MDYFQKRDYAAILAEHSTNATSDTAGLPDYAGPLLRNLAGAALADDFQLLEPEVAAEQTQDVASTPGSFADQWVVFAYSGQGDFWLLDRTRNNVGFYDHNQEDYRPENVVSLDITLEDWVVLADLWRQFDALNETNPAAFNRDFTLKPDYRANLVEQVERIQQGLFSRFPFNAV
ncbi:hypothetical protein [Hymenobacter sp. CRA2]|uniref:hypothetical protein n=1 Tax=Hymenobacter sp. CRA2 TaxID=1955620 RepID=UPI0009903154|nr:hypothetical protein [Hymenobacter sp. CRA2]OON69093.1 hypothetical protein B0919_10305 [Hymenobacter sp. CRA2]